MNLTAKQNKCLEIMEKSYFVELTTINSKGFPSTRAMLNLRNKNLYPNLLSMYEEEENPLTVYLTTNTDSEKIKEIEGNGRACLYYCEPGSFLGITLQGLVEHVTDKEFKRRVWQEEWEKYYPKGDDDYSVLLFIPFKLKMYSDFQVIAEEV